MPTTTLGYLNAEWFKEYLQWSALLGNVKQRLDSQVATERPIAICYVHKAGHRIIRERIAQLVSIPHKKLVPVFLVVTDVYSIDDAELTEVRRAPSPPTLRPLSPQSLFVSRLAS